MLRTLARMTAAIGLVCAVPAYALGLGEIEVRSKLNQRFSASIQILDATAQDLETLQVALASAADFERSGIERADYLSSLTMKLESGAGGTRVAISSPQIDHEPFLNFLVEARWQGGRLQREYTVLLDPPNLGGGSAVASAPLAAAKNPPAPSSAVAAADTPPVAASDSPNSLQPFDAPGAAPATTATGADKSPAQNAAPNATPNAASNAAPNATQNAVPAPTPPTTAPQPAPALDEAAGDGSGSGRTYGPIDPQETLWSIANKVKPAGATIDQILWALYDANPGAFDRGRFNGLMRGVTLSVPADSVIERVPPATAQARVAELRRGGRPSGETPETSGVSPKASSPSARSAASEKADRSVTEAVPAEAVAAPFKSPAEQKSTGTGKAAPLLPTGPSVAPKAEKPAPAVDAAAPSAAPTSIPPSNSSSNSSSAPSSNPVTAAAEPTPIEPVVAPPKAASDMPAAGESTSSAAAEPTTSGGAATQDAASASAAPPGQTAPAAAVPPPAVPAGSTTVNNYSLTDEFRLPLLAIIVVLLVGLVGWRMTRPKPSADKAPSQGPIANKMSGPNAAPGSLATQNSPTTATDLEATRALGETAGFVKQTVEPRPFAGEQGVVLRPDIEPLLPPASAPVAPAREPDMADRMRAQTVAPRIDGNDPIAEADFHLAYGLYDEAAILLRRALEKEPARKDLRIKLAETYFGARKAPEFQQTALALRGQIPAADWQKLAAMGRQISPDIGAFRDESAAAPSTAAAAAVGASTGVLSPASTTSAPASVTRPAPVVEANTVVPPQVARAEPEPKFTETKAPESASNHVEFNFDEAANAVVAPPPTQRTPDDSNLIDFDLETALSNLGTKPAPEEPVTEPSGAPKLSLHDFDLSEPPPSTSTPQKADEAALEFQLDDVDLSDSFPETPVLSAEDEISTKLDLARAYADMGDNQSADGLLQEVIATGSVLQKQEAETLARRLRSV